jgi:hypothetical protein
MGGLAGKRAHSGTQAWSVFNPAFEAKARAALVFNDRRRALFGSDKVFGNMDRHAEGGNGESERQSGVQGVAEKFVDLEKCHLTVPFHRCRRE